MSISNPPGTTVHRKPNGFAYLYAVESYWDKEKKAPRNKQVCLGRYNEETGEVTPSGRAKKGGAEKPDSDFKSFKASAKVYGPHLLLMKLANDIGLVKILKKSLPDFHERILSLVFFVVQKGLALSRCEMWSENHLHPFNQPISSQQVSVLLKQITEDRRQHFLSLWLEHLLENELLCYDITSISSYATANEYVRWGYNRDKEKLPQINLAMLYGQNSALPAYYRRIQGNITDVTTLTATIDNLGFLGGTKLFFILDRGFYSEKNVDALLAKRYRFVLMVRTDRIWVRDIIDKYYDQAASPDKYRQTGEDEVLYTVSHLHKWGGRRCYVHLYYNATRAAEDFDKLNKKLVACKDELERDDLDSAHQELYKRFFIIKRTPKRGLSVSYNNKEIQKYRKRYAGFSCILTNAKMDSGELLEIYRKKDIVENCFDDLKNSLDMKRLRVHSSGAMDTRLFIQFLASILLSKIRLTAKSNKELQYKSPREIMEAMESIVRITYQGRRGSVISEIGPFRQTIIKTFGFDLTT
jgi:transposase